MTARGQEPDTRTLRQQFLDTAAEIEAIYADTHGAIGYDGRQRIRKAHAGLQQLAAWIPDSAAGWLRYSDMPEADLAKARRNAERGLASPEVTRQLIAQVHALRQQLTAFGGAYGVTEEDITSMISEGFATAWRKGIDTPESVVIWKLIKDMDSEAWGAVIDFVAGPVIAYLREAEKRDRVVAGRRAFEQFYRNADQEPPDWEVQGNDIKAAWFAIARAVAGQPELDHG